MFKILFDEATGQVVQPVPADSYLAVHDDTLRLHYVDGTPVMGPVFAGFDLAMVDDPSEKLTKLWYKAVEAEGDAHPVRYLNAKRGGLRKTPLK